MAARRVITIVGGGSSAHILIPMLSMAGHSVNLLTGKPEQWSSTVETQLQTPSREVERVFSGTLNSASNKASEVIPQASIIILCMPVSEYRRALHHIAPHISKVSTVFLGAIYGQSGVNWMVDEIKALHGLGNVVTFAVGLIPWICRTLEYGRLGVTFGPKAVNVVAVSPRTYFDELQHSFLHDICERWFDTGAFHLADNFLSLTLSVDNQVIHPSRCYGMAIESGGLWERKEDIPLFYKDYDQASADLLEDLDRDYSKIRRAIMDLYPEKRFDYMLDYLSLERLSYQSGNTDIRESFTNSRTLATIALPTKRLADGSWTFDTEHRFFKDDIRFGLCIAQWMADRLAVEVPVIEKIITWSEFLCQSHARLFGRECNNDNYGTGLPSGYGFSTIEDVVD